MIPRVVSSPMPPAGFTSQACRVATTGSWVAVLATRPLQEVAGAAVQVIGEEIDDAMTDFTKLIRIHERICIRLLSKVRPRRQFQLP